MKGMSRSERRKLEQNKHVLKLTEKHVVYTKEFKLKAVKASLKGKAAEDIFTDAGIDLSIFKSSYGVYAIKR